jgi:apolipoprotein D and lipocalin family protein
MRTDFQNSRSLAILPIVLAVLSAGCPSNPPETAAFVDLERYAGKWYEIARFPVFFENGLTGVTAEYALQVDGTVRVTNRGMQGALDGPESKIQGVAKVVDTETNSRLSVRFDPFPVCLFSADYWIIEVGQEYEYAVVSNPMRNILWILSRTPQMDQTLYDDVVGRLGAEGFDTAKLELTPQPAE